MKKARSLFNSILIIGLLLFSASSARAEKLTTITNSNVPVAANTSVSLSSGDISFCSDVGLDAAEAALGSPESNAFTLGELGITVRWFAGTTLLQGISLPTAPSIIDAPLFASKLFFSAACANCFPGSEQKYMLASVASATRIGIRATAIVKNTTAATRHVNVALRLLATGTACP